MPDIRSRYVLELDSVGLMGQLAAVEAQAGAQISQMAQPIQSSIAQTFQTGTQGLVAAQGAVLRAASYMGGPQGAAGFLGAASGMGMLGGGGGYSGAALGNSNFWANSMPAAGIHKGFVDTAMRAFGLAPQEAFQFTPEEASRMYSRQVVRDAQGAVLGATTTGAQLLGGYGGYSMGSRIGAAFGRGLGLGEAGEQVFGSMGALAGARFGSQLYGPAGGATIGAGLGGALGGAIGNLPVLSNLPLIGPLLSGLGAVGSTVGSAVGGLAGAAAGGLGQLTLDTLNRRQAVRGLLDDLSIPGGGLSEREADRASKGLNRMVARDYRFDTEQYGKIMQAGADAGRYTGVTSASQFNEVTQKLVNDVKTVQTALRKNLDDSLQFMQDAIATHGTRTNIADLAQRYRGLAQATGISPDQLIRAGVLAPSSGASSLLGGIPEIAREMGINRGEVLEAGLSGMAMSKGQMMDVWGFRAGVAGLAGARSLMGADPELVASAGGPERLGQMTQGAMQSWLQSGTAKMMALAGGGGGSWADTASRAMGRIQNFGDAANFELGYAREMSRLSPAEIARRMRGGASMVARELGVPTDYVLFKQLKAQGMGDIQAIAAIDNLGQVERGVGDVGQAAQGAAAQVAPATVNIDDSRRARGLAGQFQRAKRGLTERIDTFLDRLDEGYYGPALSSVMNALTGEPPPGQTPGQAIGTVAGNVKNAVMRSLPLLKSGVSQVLLPGLQDVGQQLLTDMGISRQTQATLGGAARRVGAGVETAVTWVQEAMAARPGAEGILDRLGGAARSLGAMTLAAFDTRSSTPAAMASPHRDTGEVVAASRHGIGAEAHALAASSPEMAKSPGGGTVESRPGLGALDDMYSPGLVDEEKAIQDQAAVWRRLGVPDERIQSWIDRKHAELEKRRGLQKREAKAAPEAHVAKAQATPGAVTVTPAVNAHVTYQAGQQGTVQAAPAAKKAKKAPLTEREKLLARFGGKETAAADSVLRAAGVGREDAMLRMMRGVIEGEAPRSKADLRKKLLASAQVNAQDPSVPAAVREGLEREADELSGRLWDPKTNSVREGLAVELAQGAQNLQNYKESAKGLTWGEKTKGADADLIEGLFSTIDKPGGEAGSVYSELRSSEKSVAGLARDITRLSGSQREAVQGTFIGKLNRFARDMQNPNLTMEEMQAKLSSAGLSYDAQQRILNMDRTESDVGQAAAEEVLKEQGQAGLSANQTNEAVNTLVAALRAILDVAKH